MRNPSLSRRRRDLLTSTLLAMLLFRAYVPVGFMPASGAPFLVELCPAASSMPMDMSMAHHHHSSGHGVFESCPFGSAPAAGPLSTALDFQAPEPIAALSAPLFEQCRFDQRTAPAHRPRGPPSPA